MKIKKTIHVARSIYTHTHTLPVTLVHADWPNTRETLAPAIKKINNK